MIIHSTILAQFLIQMTWLYSQTPTLMTGSTVVAIRTPSEIYVGADSKLVAYGDIKIEQSMCKIRQVDSLFFAHTGLIGDAAGRFNVAETVIKAHRYGHSISATVQAFEKMVVGPLIKTLQQFKRDQPDYYTKYLQAHSHFSIIFFGLENETPVVYSRYFNAKDSTDGSIKVDIQRKDCPGNCPTGMTYIFLGEQEAISKFLDGNPHYSSVGWVPTIRKLIEIEIADKPDFVGYPIDIIRVDKKAAEWIQRKKKCPDIQVGK
jgi:Proteasome subunit